METMRLSFFVPPALLLGSAAPLHAAEGGLLEVSTGLMVWTIVIFLIVLGVLSRFAFPMILGAVEAREAHLRETIEAAERDRAEAAALVAEARREMEETRARAHEAIAEGRTQAERMKEEFMADARGEREEIIARARREIGAERVEALDSVRRDAVDLTIRAAERLVRHTLDAEENRRLVREYLEQLSEPSVPAGA